MLPHCLCCPVGVAGGCRTDCRSCSYSCVRYVTCLTRVSKQAAVTTWAEASMLLTDRVLPGKKSKGGMRSTLVVPGDPSPRDVP